MPMRRRADEVEMNAVEVNHRIDGEGPPLYMVHGIGARMTAWDGVLDGLRAHFACVRYDLRGHGMSPAPAPPYSLAQLVADLEALRRRLGHERIHIIGHSLGGMIAPAYARAHPDRVLSLGLLSTAAARGREDRAKLRAVGAAMQAHGVEATVGAFVDRWFTDAFIAAEPDLIAMRIRQINDTPEAVFRSVFQLYAETEMQPWLREIACPCLVLTGALDNACNPRLNRRIAGELPHAELVILEDLKHAILLEAPQRVLASLKKFLLNQIA
ncbi:MAG: alpha/beta fold hydrolase [bacterium]